MEESAATLDDGLIVPDPSAGGIPFGKIALGVVAIVIVVLAILFLPKVLSGGEGAEATEATEAEARQSTGSGSGSGTGSGSTGAGSSAGCPSCPPCPPPAPSRPDKFYLGATCPAGWQDLGAMGLIVENAQERSAPFAVGGAYNSGWKWMHPRLCRGGAATLPPQGLFKFAEAGSLKVGVLSSTAAPLTRVSSGIQLGGAHHADWRWAHPFLVPASQPGGFSVSMPDHHGVTGLIANKANGATVPFPQGGDYNTGWSWTHPFFVRDQL